jgi:amino-acid N-acetyltransferase
VSEDELQQGFVEAFRDSAPYINAFRGRIFVLTFGGEAVADNRFHALIHDIALLNSLGIRLVLVHGARPQIEQRLQREGIDLHYVNGMRVTDAGALECVKEAASTVRMEIEAHLSMGLANSPMAGARIRVASGNFVTAQPLGIREGVDYQHTGEVRRVDVSAIEERLAHQDIVLLSPIGYSPTGEIFNLTAEEVARAAAVHLQADKLIFLSESGGPRDNKKHLFRQLSVGQAESLLARETDISEECQRHIQAAIQACRHGVRRTHIVDRHTDGALLLELFTRDGIGSLITDDLYDDMRTANIDDVAGIIALIEPLEKDGVMVRRSRELLEMEIDNFVVMERDGTVLGCAALYTYEDPGIGELACLAIHPDYHKQGRGDSLLKYIETQARATGLDQLFVLTTHTAHWFQERGFVNGELQDLPVKKQQLYNYQRNSKVFIKNL